MGETLFRSYFYYYYSLPFIFVSSGVADLLIAKIELCLVIRGFLKENGPSAQKELFVPGAGFRSELGRDQPGPGTAAVRRVLERSGANSVFPSAAPVRPGGDQGEGEGRGSFACLV